MTKYTPKPYTLIQVIDGREWRQYENGDIRDQNGLMIAPLKGGNEPITSETARDYAKRRKDKILRAIESRIMDITHTNAPADAIAHIVGKRAEIALSDDTRTGNDAAKIVLSALDAYQDKHTETISTTRNEYAMDAETLDVLSRLHAQRADVIDAQATTIRNDDDEKNTEEE